MAKESVDCEFWLPDDLFFGEDDFTLPKDDGSAMASSPQSTLCADGFLSGSGGSSPPPSTEEQNREKQTLAVLSQAAGQVMQLKLNEEKEEQRVEKEQQNPKPSVYQTSNNNNGCFGFYQNQSMTQQQFQAAQFDYLRRQEILKHQQFTNALLWEKQRNMKRPPLGLPQSAWPPLSKPRQQPALPAQQAGMRAVFLAGTKKESAGTGVFLPKRPGSPTNPRKKSVCSTVLLPARVVQALNLNLDELRAPARSVSGAYVLDHDAMIGRSSAMNQSKKRVNGSEMERNQIRKNMVKNEEICLPKEWIY